jgi:hypothetical protein
MASAIEVLQGALLKLQQLEAREAAREKRLQQLEAKLQQLEANMSCGEVTISPT